MTTKQPSLDQVDLVMSDLEAWVAFYRALGLDIPDSALWRTPSGVHHVDLRLPNGLTLHFDSPRTRQDLRPRLPRARGTRTLLTFHVETRDEVDRLHQKLTGMGHASSQPPYDAFWGARFAIVADPDGHLVGIMSPSDPARRGAPPDL